MRRSTGGYLPTSHDSYLVRARVNLRGICGGQSGTVAGFLRVLRFPVALIVSSNSFTIFNIYLPWHYNRPINSRSNKELGSTLLPELHMKTVPNNVGTSHVKMKTDPVLEPLCFLFFIVLMMDEDQKERQGTQ
jgi:hypothetical protein